ncbi:MAG TPA: hypothetical protein VMU77_04510, partial [Acidimicrobiales bacterium]|nr:hypothetical protein [Acidimicrobiales bacterium]
MNGAVAHVVIGICAIAVGLLWWWGQSRVQALRGKVGGVGRNGGVGGTGGVGGVGRNGGIKRQGSIDSRWATSADVRPLVV